MGFREECAEGLQAALDRTAEIVQALAQDPGEAKINEWLEAYDPRGDWKALCTGMSYIHGLVTARYLGPLRAVEFLLLLAQALWIRGFLAGVQEGRRQAKAELLTRRWEVQDVSSE